MCSYYYSKRFRWPFNLSSTSQPIYRIKTLSSPQKIFTTYIFSQEILLDFFFWCWWYSMEWELCKVNIRFSDKLLKRWLGYFSQKSNHLPLHLKNHKVSGETTICSRTNRKKKKLLIKSKHCSILSKIGK